MKHDKRIHLSSRKPGKYQACCSAWALMLAFLLSSVQPSPGQDALVKLLEILQARGSISQEEYEQLKSAATAAPQAEAPLVKPMVPQPPTSEIKSVVDDAIDEAIKDRFKNKWYEQLKFSGYTQVRYTGLMNEDGSQLNVPNDRSVAHSESFRIRRGRLKFSGDVSEHLYLYAQTDVASSFGGTFGLQLRDLYGDVYFDKDKEHRLRIGQSKVPFGFVNMQSSQNRAPLERADGLNSALENERDVGAFYYYTPEEVRARFKEIKDLGLKHSGNYGMLGLGVYNGQGPNRGDLNGKLHTVARATYPFKFQSGQLMEVGVQGYFGQFLVTRSDPDGAGPLGVPYASGDGTVDQRVGGSFVYYPQPWGFEAEWNVGRGPALSGDFTRIDSSFLHGGYLMTYYKADTSLGRFFPYLRWHYYDGGRKFAANAPSSLVNEMDLGIEFSPWSAVEFSLQYTKTFDRTNTGVFPYAATSNADRLALQLQINY